MPDGQPIGRACENVFAHGWNQVGLSNGKNFRVGPGSPKNVTITIQIED